LFGEKLLAYRILSVSYDEPLLKTRELLLKQHADYDVTSALGFTAARARCSEGGFDLFILGHSIPARDKRELIHCFRTGSKAPILALRKMGETMPDDADEHVDPNDIEALLRMVETLLAT
jgi:DNA-binding response OmpR family regulator